MAYSLPYALSAPARGPSIDVYGRYRGIQLFPFQGTQEEKAQPAFSAVFKPVYHVMPIGYEPHPLDAVIIKDYTDDISQISSPRVDLNRPILEIMADLIPFLRTALMTSTGVRGVRVNNQNEVEDIREMVAQINLAALSGHPYVPVQGQVDFQDLTPGTVAKAEEYLLALQSLDNYRLSLLGIDNGGLFRKKTHVLQSEQSLNSETNQRPKIDGLEIRRRACDIANSIWGWRAWVDYDDGDAAFAEQEGDEVFERFKKTETEEEMKDDTSDEPAL